MALIAEEGIGARAYYKKEDNQVCQKESVEPAADGGVGNTLHPAWLSAVVCKTLPPPRTLLHPPLLLLPLILLLLPLLILLLPPLLLLQLLLLPLPRRRRRFSSSYWHVSRSLHLCFYS